MKINVIHINRMKGKKHTIILINSGKKLKNSTPFDDKNTQQTGNRRKLPQHNKGI